MDPLSQTLKDAPPLSSIPSAELKITPLGGITNQTLRLQHPKIDAVLRLPGGASAPMINRWQEAHNQRIAALAGIALPPLWSEPSSGRRLTPYLPHHRAPSPHSPTDLKRVGALLGRVHRLKGSFQGIKIPEAIASAYEATLRQLDAALPEAYPQALATFETILKTIALAPWPLGPSHMDPGLANVLLGPKGAPEDDYLIDWEFSGVASPAWDVAIVALEASLNIEDTAQLLDAAGLPSGPGPRARIELYQVIITFIWGQWALVRHSLGDDMRAWGEGCFKDVATWGASGDHERLRSTFLG